jgi:hypothetical protein
MYTIRIVALDMCDICHYYKRLAEIPLPEKGNHAGRAAREIIIVENKHQINNKNI